MINGEFTTITRSYVRYARGDVPYFLKDNKRVYFDEYRKEKV
jgi:hypothetical protein